MSAIPGKYAHVMNEDAPSLIRTAMRLYGTREVVGSGNNPVIMSWVPEVERALGLKAGQLGYTADKIPWCGLFAGVVAARANWAEQMPKTPLWARSWADFGQKSDKPSFGDVLVFSRKGGGHVGFYVAEGPGVFHVLGGNQQSDEVNIVRILKSRMIACRRPKWRISQPASVRPIWIDDNGAVSRNEA